MDHHPALTAGRVAVVTGAASGIGLACSRALVIDDLGIRMAAALDDHFRQFGNVTVVP